MKYEVISLQPHKVEGRAYFEHFSYLERQNIVRMNYLEYSLHKQVVWILRGKENSPLTRVVKNTFGIMELFMSRGMTLIIGAAAFSPFAFLINKLKARHKCIFYTSWPYWEEERFPKTMFQSSLKKAWRKFLDGIICVSVTEYPCKTLAKYGAIPYYIPYAVNLELFRPAISRPFSSTVRVLFVGHLMEAKGIALILSIIRKYKWENAEFVFVGNGPYKGEIIRMQKEGHPVRYLGFCESKSKLVSIYQRSDILILPSIITKRDEEKFGVVLIEAMACQLPVIASDCIGPRQVVEDAVTGIVIPQNDQEALRDAILKLIKAPELRSKFGENGRKRVQKFYNVKIVAKKWLKVIERVNRIEKG
jgi:glycosyltransferase involved in cell wall biosynthesis